MATARPCVNHLVLFTRASAKMRLAGNSWTFLKDLSASVFAVE
jgi:hypothetical protein